MNQHVKPQQDRREWQAIEYNILARMAKAGKTDEEIAQILGRPLAGVRNKRQIMGVPTVTASPQQAWDEDQVERLENLIASGMSDQEIADDMGRTLQSVMAKRLVLGLTRREVRQPKKEGRIEFSSVREALRYPPQKITERDRFELDAQLRAFALAMRQGGHKHGTGELIISADDRIPLRITPELARSPIGSSAAACVG